MKPTDRPSAADPPRTCVEEATFAEQKEKLGVDVKRLDEILDGLLLRIARFPERSHVVPTTSLRTEMSMPFEDAPTIIVTFAYDESHVYMLWIDLY
jgi:hypothetical protein